MIRVLHTARAESGNGKTLDLELWLNQIGGIFKQDEEAPEDDDSLQAALSAKICKKNYENRGTAAYARNGLKKNQELRSPKPESSVISKLTQEAFDLEAE